MTPYNLSSNLIRPYFTYQDIRIQHKKYKKKKKKKYTNIYITNLTKFDYLQQQVPLPLPCYDFAAVLNDRVTSSNHDKRNYIFKTKITNYNNKIKIPHLCLLTPNSTAWRAVCTRACKYSPLHDDKRLLAIPTSCFRITENNLNYDYF